MEYQLSQFDILERPKWPLRHQGLYLGDDLVFHCTPEKGEHVSTLEEFRNGQPITVIRNSIESANEIGQRLLKRLQLVEKYNYLSNNCEDAVSRVLAGRPSSSQRVVILSSIAILVALYLLSRRK